MNAYEKIKSIPAVYVIPTLLACLAFAHGPAAYAQEAPGNNAPVGLFSELKKGIFDFSQLKNEGTETVPNAPVGGEASGSVAADTQDSVTAVNPVPKAAPKVIPKKAAPSNNVGYGRVGRPSRILASTNVVNGQNVCEKKNDHPKVSSRNPKWQIDGECCLDPYEIPNSNCYYPPAKYGYLIQKYLASKR